MALFQDFGQQRMPWPGFVGVPYHYGPATENLAVITKERTTNGPIIVEVEPSEPGGAKSEIASRNVEQPQFVQPNCLKSNRTYNRRLGSKSYLIDEGSEATTAKTTSTRSKPWREVNDEIAARMMAASSDSPPLIPRRDYDDGGQFAAKNMAMINRPKPPASYNTTSECSSTDDCKNLIDNNRRHPFEYQQQLTLYRGPNFEPGIDSVPIPIPMPYDANAFPCHMMPPPPGLAFMGQMGFQQDPAFMGDAPPFQCDFMPPLPMMPPAFMPPMMHSQDFESIMLLKQKKLKKKKMKRRSHSMEALPPPMFGMPPPPHFFGPPMGPPVPGPWGCPQMSPFIAGNGPLALEYPGANRDCEQEAGRYQLPHAPIIPGGGPFVMPPPPPSQVAMNPCVDDVPPTTTYHQLGGAFDQKMTHSGDGDIFKDKESYRKEKIHYASCCKNFSQVLWIIIGIVLVGLILGLVLGLTLV